MARSELTAAGALRAGIVALGLAGLGGCDLVVGMSGDARACGNGAFNSTSPTALLKANAFSIDWD